MKNIEYLTGLHGIEERLKSSKKAEALFYDKETERIRPLIKLAHRRNIPVRQVKRDELKNIGAFHAALAVPVQESGGQKWFGKKLEKLKDKEEAFVVVLDGITDPHNLGAILRSACLFGVDLVLYPERRSAQGDTDTVTRVSAGAADIIAHGAVANLNRILDEFKKENFWIYGSAAHGESIAGIKAASKKVLVMGSEGRGISALTKKNCDIILTIPTNHKLDSLNVSAASAIFMYQLSAYSGRA
jgi:23S rRNA (guanosine2251-2'-O)-methyltransferase